MPFDHILGVGRSPKVTNDLSFNVYSIDISKIQDYALLTKYLGITGSGLGTASTYPDRPNNFTDPNVPETDYSLRRSYVSGSFSNITFDLGRNLYMDKVVFSYSLVGDGDLFTWRIQVSDDGVNYSDVSTGTDTSATGEETIKYVSASNLKGKYIRFRMEMTTFVSPATIIYFYKFKLYFSNLQY